MNTIILDAIPANVLNALAVTGVVLALPYTYRFLNFLWLYFLRPDSSKRYLHGTAPYALVTGATDGIGKATAAELVTRGFNVILHGRNEAKMQKVVHELRARVEARGGSKGKEADIRYIIADASKAKHDWAAFIEPLKDLHLTVVVHNVGGAEMSAQRTDGHTEDAVLGTVYKNSLFPLFLTRALLPQLRRATSSGPVQVLFVGSVAGDIAPPRLPVYAASKGFLQSLSRGLDNDELFFSDDAPTGVRFTYLAVGGVHSDNHESPMPPSLTVPTSERFARALVDTVGCGRRRVAPYYVHAVQSWFVGLLPDALTDTASAQEMRSLITRLDKGK